MTTPDRNNGFTTGENVLECPSNASNVAFAVSDIEITALAFHILPFLHFFQTANLVT